MAWSATTVLTAAYLLICGVFAVQAQGKVYSIELSSGRALNECMLYSVDEDSLRFASIGVRHSVSLDEVQRLIYTEEPKFTTGALIGGGIGLLAGALIGYLTAEQPRSERGLEGLFKQGVTSFSRGAKAMVGGLIGLIGGGLLGGAISSSANPHELIDLSTFSRRTKAAYLRTLI